MASSDGSASRRAGSSKPSSAARAMACRRSMRCGSRLGKESIRSSSSGVGNASASPPGSAKVRPWVAESRRRTAVACVRCRRWLRIDQAAASYGEWKSTGRSPGSSDWSRPMTGSRSPTWTQAGPDWSRDSTRRTWASTRSGSASPYSRQWSTPSASWTTYAAAWCTRSSATNARDIESPSGLGRPVLGPNPKLAAAASENAPSGVMVSSCVAESVTGGCLLAQADDQVDHHGEHDTDHDAEGDREEQREAPVAHRDAARQLGDAHPGEQQEHA